MCVYIFIYVHIYIYISSLESIHYYSVVTNTYIYKYVFRPFHLPPALCVTGCGRATTTGSNRFGKKIPKANNDYLCRLAIVLKLPV
jgi:hypothetical protein